MLQREVAHAVLSERFTPDVHGHHITHDIHVRGVLGKEFLWLSGALQEL